MKKINIAYFAVGSALKFDKKKLLRSDGTNEYYLLAKLLAKNSNVDRVILLSRSDWARISLADRLLIDPHNRIFDPYSEFPELKARPKDPKTAEDKIAYYSVLYDLLEKNNIKIDFGLGFISQGWACTSLPGFFNTLRPPFRPSSALDMTLFYAADILYYLNMSGLKWWLLATDPRYVTPSMRKRDITNIPQGILGQQDFDIAWFHAKSMDRSHSIENDGYVIENIKSEYSGIEKINLIDDEVLDISNLDKPHKFTTVSMQLSTPSSEKDLRFNILKEYVLDRDPDQSAHIFGKWSDFYKKGYSQFKGYIATADLDRTFAETRYTLVLPTAAGWVTSKYAEMLQLGVLPFLHPAYDTQNHIVPADHFIRVKSANDFYKKMEYLDKNPSDRISIVKKLQETLCGEAFSGKFMIDLINRKISGMNIALSDSADSLFDKKAKIIEKPSIDVTSFFE